MTNTHDASLVNGRNDLYSSAGFSCTSKNHDFTATTKTSIGSMRYTKGFKANAVKSILKYERTFRLSGVDKLFWIPRASNARRGPYRSLQFGTRRHAADPAFVRLISASLGYGGPLATIHVARGIDAFAVLFGDVDRGL